MKISIITVCYNSANTIEKTFKSVQNQIYENIEYIVIDGGSKDATLTIVNKHKDLISKLVSEPDKGLYDAMNKGVKLATGDIVGVLNSDDIFTDEFVLKNIAKFHLENDIDASVGNIIQFNEAWKNVRKYSSKNWTPENLKIGFMPPHPSIFFKRELFEKYGNYHLDFISGADYELIIRFFLKNNISWKFSNITTTAMLIGGISSSGISSYVLITKEICKALFRNNIKFSPVKVCLRGFWKFLGFINKQ
ncbi:glycosyltransferase [Flavobacteriaceae bacterium]|nr:glycosyltransferase [Flavobacteriaceae bacterium]MDC0593346.1 glycosyltransferase [Flavobacteriaceae bacterium]